MRSDENRILTCFLEYFPSYVNVTDLLYEKEGGKWNQQISSYKKIRITDHEVEEILISYKMKIISNLTNKGTITIVAQK